MEKITKSTDTVLIDPNEPLILPDGTALVGRIEWFLYALCCLDYQNLPTPMSRIEEFANALITGEIPNIEPQSRAEQFFLAILDGNVSNLPQPQSRSEVLLDKLARGEFDLSDVEPIQSRYELLLAYLIKNGGIGNIDYVLYEFSEAMKTMYNTVEKPFKSLELSGNTLVNCVLEDTENDDYTSFDKDYSGTSFTINGTSEGAIKSAILKGQTLVNLRDVSNPKLNKPSTMDVTIHSITKSKIELTINVADNNTWGYISLPIKRNMFKPSTKYIVMGDFQNIVDIKISTGNSQVSWAYSSTVVDNKYCILTTHSTLPDDTSDNVILFCNLKKVDGTTCKLNNVVLLEYQNGMENWNIPYFEGMQSVKMPVLKATGKNLFDLELTQGGHGYGVTGIKPNFNGSNTRVTNLTGTYIKVNPNTKITFSILNNIDFAIAELDINGYSLGDTGWVGYATIKPNHTITTKEKTSYIGFNFRKFDNSNITVQEVLDSNPMLEISGTATTYEPYKSNILTTTSKNLFDMNRPYDVITDSQATVVQDTNKITVSSVESGTYVSANFILDKDFFAGKTVTGSCLYESDIKDIGTVQIHYQDGNGDHHYQWIRTPKTFTFPNNFIGDVMLCVSANNTGTPQSNTVTVKNIQLELGSNATTYEPYSKGVTLRGIGDVQDSLNLSTGELTERIREVILDGTEGWALNRATTNHILWQTTIANPAFNSSVRKNNMLCNKLIVEDFSGFDTKDYEFISINNGSSNIVYLKLDKTKASTLTELKNYLQSNPLTVQYQLATPNIKAVDLNVVDQNNTKIDKMHVFNEVTHVNASSDGLTPTVNIGKSVSYPTIIKPSTKYTVDLKRNDKPLTVNLGGTEVTFADGETRKIITTPSTLTNDKLSYYGIGAKCNKIMLIEGEVEGNVDYFTGMQSVVMQNQMPILSTVGKNLFDGNRRYESSHKLWFAIPFEKDSYFTFSSFDTIPYIEFYGTTTEFIDKLYGGDGVSWKALTTFSNKESGTFKKESKYNHIIIAFDKAKLSNGEDFLKNLQVEQGTQATSYEPYKSSILSCNEDVALREIGDVRDTLDLMTGEVTERVGEIVLDGSQDVNSWWNTTSTIGVGTPIPTMKNISKLNCDKLPVVSHEAMNNDTYDKDGVASWDNGNIIRFRIEKSKLSTEDVNGVKQYLQSNPITIQYELINKSVKTVDLSVVDQDGNTIPKIKSYEDVTHLEVTVPKQSLLPNVSAEVATDNSKDMSSLTIKYQEISEAQATIQDNIQSQSDEIDTALMATTEIFESILE